MNPTSLRRFALLALCLLVLPVAIAHAQGVTTGSITGVVVDAQNSAVPGATVVAVHEPSGTRYEATTRTDGHFSIPGMRVGGPYTVTATLSGFQAATTKDLIISLGVATDLHLELTQAGGHRRGHRARRRPPTCSAPRAPAPPPRSSATSLKTLPTSTTASTTTRD